MIRHFVVGALLGLALSACGVGADEDINSLGQALSASSAAPASPGGTNSSSQDPIPPKILLAGAGSAAPGSPGSTNSSSQDPIPPKVQPTRLTSNFR